jgi:uncharacterized repeat protein (TIGR01451 family)
LVALLRETGLMDIQVKRWCWALWATALLLPLGCAELGIEPLSKPSFGDRAATKTTAAKTPVTIASPGSTIQMEILPVEATSPVQTVQVLIATVHDKRGSPYRNCRVEWRLEGVGEIVAVDESGANEGRAQRLDANNAVSFTESEERLVSRSGDAASGFIVKPGQSWCVIKSSLPGDSQVLAHAADSPNQSVIVRHWVEDERVFPQKTVQRPDDGITQAHYESPAISLVLKAPAAVAAGQDVPCTLSVNNAGASDAHGLTVHATIPDGLQYSESTPSAVVEGKQLIWTIDALSARHSQPLQIVYKSTKPGACTHHASLSTGEGVSDEKSFVTEVTNPQLKVNVSGPASVSVGIPATFEITVRNLGSGPAKNLLLSDALDAGLEHATKANPIELPLGVLAAGEKKSASLILIPRTAGPLSHHLTVTADGNLTAHADSTLNGQQGKIEVQVLGPTLRYVGRPAVWDIQVNNPGTTPLTNVAVSALVPAELTVVSASEGGQVSGESRGGEVHWRLGKLGPREQKVVQVTTRCDQMAERSPLRATVTADPDVQVRSEAVLAVRGLPAYRIHVVDLKDPIQVGERTTYRIEVSNQGTLPGKQVQVTAEAPPQLRVIGARGPSQPSVEGRKIVFPPLETLATQQNVTFEVECEALQPNDALFHVELQSPDLTNPIAVEESTTIYAPGAQKRPAAAPATGQGNADSFQTPPPANTGSKPPPDWSIPAESPTPAPAPTGSNWRLRR